MSSIRESDTQIIKGLTDEGLECRKVEEGKVRWRKVEERSDLKLFFSPQS